MQSSTIRCTLLLWLLWLLPLAVHGNGRELLLALRSGNELSIEQFGTGAERLLWLPSEFGMFGEPERQHAGRLAQQGYSVWLVDLHNNYFITSGRNSLDEIPIVDVVDLISHAQHGVDKLYLYSYSRGAKLLLNAVREWQRQRESEQPALAGVLLMHPDLLLGVAQAGVEPRFDPIASATNLPLYIFQPVDSGKRWYMQKMVTLLEKGGSDVFTHRLFGVSDGYAVSDMARDYELERRKEVPELLVKGMRRLQGYADKPRQAAAMLGKVESPVRVASAGLRPVEEALASPALRLTTMAGEVVDLQSLRGEVVLVNFWASWCPPCIEEIPSLGRLNKRLSHRPFQVISVDVGETKEQVQPFLSKIPADFPVMMDPDGTTVGPWNIRAFPTSFVIDQRGVMRYGYVGGLEWDTDEVIARLGTLLSEQHEIQE